MGERVIRRGGRHTPHVGDRRICSANIILVGDSKFSRSANAMLSKLMHTASIFPYVKPDTS